jgi:hypothetical protein
VLRRLALLWSGYVDRGVTGRPGLDGLIAALETYREDQAAFAGPVEPVIKE